MTDAQLVNLLALVDLMRNLALMQTAMGAGSIIAFTMLILTNGRLLHRVRELEKHKATYTAVNGLDDRVRALEGRRPFAGDLSNHWPKS